MIRKVLPLYFALVMLIFSGCKKFQNPEFRRLEHFKIEKVGFDGVAIGFTVTYFNPNNFRVNVKEAVADVYADSIFLGRFTQDTLVSVGKNAEFSVPFSGKISMKTALQFNYESLSEREISIKATGSARVGKAGVYVSKPFSYEGKHRMSELNLSF